jgi:energy-coupling factor transporter ATP-binding protein EcfA2
VVYPDRSVTYLFPANAPAGNAGINPKHLMDFLERQNAVEADYEEEEEAPRRIPPPKILLSRQIEHGLTVPDEPQSVFGYPIDTYEPFRVPLFAREGNFVNSLMVIGDQGQGKSTIGTYFAGLTVNRRGYILCIDPDADEEQSLSKRLGPLSHYLLCEIADTPEKAKRLLALAESEIKQPGDYPLLLLVDEFSLIMRHGKMGSGEWSGVASLVANVVENFATRGRKRFRRAIVFGQISNASRTGGTELRDSCAYIIFNTPYKKASLVLQDASDDEIAELAPSLTPGIAIVSPAKSSETYIMQFTFPDEDGLQRIVQRRESVESGRSTRMLPGFTDELEEGSRTFVEPEMNVDEPALEADVHKVQALYGKHPQDEIISMLWGVCKGGSPKYKEARKRYQDIVTFIETGQWPEARDA